MSVICQETIGAVEHQAQACSPQWRAAWRRVLTHTHTYSGRSDHGGTVTPPQSYQRLAQWVHERNVDAVGMGSPYTPASARTHHRYDGKDRAIYYSPGFDHHSVQQLDEIQRMLHDVQRCSGNGTLFYLDNETPKGRFGHLWWVGYHPDQPSWHDYDQDFDRWMIAESIPGDTSAEPMPYNRRPYAEIVAMQRRHGALGYWAHPTSWWRDRAGRFITNIASELPAHLLAEGFADGMVIMGYQAYRPGYLALWHLLLDAGFRLPGVAEMDVGLSSEATWQRQRVLVNCVWVGDHPDAKRLTVADLTAAFASGRLAVSSGPMVDLSIDGQPMGQVVQTSPDRRHEVVLTAFAADPRQPLGRIELRGQGEELLWAQDEAPGGTWKLTLRGLDHRGYLTARVFGPGQTGQEDDFRKVDQFAASNPVYLHPRGQTFESGMTSQVSIHPGAGSSFVGGTVRIENAAGDLLEQGALGHDGLTTTAPAHGRVTCIAPDGRSQTQYLINANPALMEVQRYLYRGRFLLDFPDRQPGDVPPAAWRLDAYRQAMRQVTLSF